MSERPLYVGLVIHEAGIKVRHDVGVLAGDVDASPRGRVLEVIEHGKELAGRCKETVQKGPKSPERELTEKAVVGIGTTDDAREHDRLVRLVFEVTVPELVEFGAELRKLLLGGPQFPSSVNGVGGQESARRLGLPFAVHLYERGVDQPVAQQEKGDGLARS